MKTFDKEDPVRMNSRRIIAVLSLGLTFLGVSCASAPRNAEPQGGERHYVFSYFTGNGEGGLHLAYSNDGYHWRALNRGASLLVPQLGREMLMRDPSIVRGPDGTYHMVWTVGWGERGIGYAHSRDLIHWSEQRYLPVMEYEPEALNSWAPELYYDDATQEYLIVWATTIPGRFPETDNQSSAGPPAPGRNHRLYYVKTRDFRTFTDTRLFYDHGFNVIDSAILRDGDRYVMFLKDETNLPFEPQKNIRVAHAERAEGPYSAPSAPITGDFWAEGPTALRTGERWFVYFDKYRERSYGVVTSSDLERWTDESDRLVVPEGMRHGTVLEIPAEAAARLLALD
jgi:hypothetical protein